MPDYAYSSRHSTSSTRSDAHHSMSEKRDSFVKLTRKATNSSTPDLSLAGLLSLTRLDDEVSELEL